MQYQGGKARQSSTIVNLLNNLRQPGQMGDLPDEITKEEYENLRWNTVESSWLRGFAGFGCSFGGKWFGGYASNADLHNYCAASRNSLLRKSVNLIGSSILNVDYSFWSPVNCLIYCGSSV